MPRAKSAQPKSSSKPQPRRRQRLPDWTDLSPNNKRVGRRTRKTDSEARLDFTLRRFAFGIAAVVVLSMLYLGHVYRTQALYAAVQDAQKENIRLRLAYNERNGALGQRTSPTVIERKARALGLKPGLAYGPTLYLDPDERPR